MSSQVCACGAPSLTSVALVHMSVVGNDVRLESRLEHEFHAACLTREDAMGRAGLQNMFVYQQVHVAVLYSHAIER